MENKNAIITKATIEIEDHGILTAMIHLDYGGSSQGFGGYFFYSPTNKHCKHKNVAGLFIWRCLEIAGVFNWDHLKGKPVRVKCEFDKVHAIGHIIKDDWFNPSDELKALEQEDCTANNAHGIHSVA